MCHKRGNADGLARQQELSALLRKTRRGASEVTRSPLNTSALLCMLAVLFCSYESEVSLC
jgi:hypothetical protein